MTGFENRLAKNARHFFKWAKRAGLTAFRVYDRDMPEAPLVVEWFDGRVHLVEFPGRRARRSNEPPLLDEARPIVARVLEVAPERIFTKTHAPKEWGKEQYEKAAAPSDRFAVEENGLKFWVDLGPFLDTGLFLDHRNTRARVRAEAAGKKVLNLFAYTGSFSVYAAHGGAARVTTVDLSNTYCDWARDNFALNGLPPGEIIRSDVLRWVRQSRERYDLVVLDPPSFSTSKKMDQSFNVQRDHVWLLRDVRALLAPGGALYFSTNFKGFELAPAAVEGASCEELTPQSIPEDFHDRRVHRCWRIGRAT